MVLYDITNRGVVILIDGVSKQYDAYNALIIAAESASKNKAKFEVGEQQVSLIANDGFSDKELEKIVQLLHGKAVDIINKAIESNPQYSQYMNIGG